MHFTTIKLKKNKKDDLIIIQAKKDIGLSAIPSVIVLKQQQSASRGTNKMHLDKNNLKCLR